MISLPNQRPSTRLFNLGKWSRENKNKPKYKSVILISIAMCKLWVFIVNKKVNYEVKTTILLRCC